MIRIERSKVPVPEVFSSKEMEIAIQKLEEFYKGRKETRSQKRYIKQFEPQLKLPILKALKSLFNGKCAYCESKIDEVTSHSLYDHHRPKHGARGLEKEFADEHYWWLTYEWNNFYYSCSICNQYKATWFPVSGKRIRVRTPYNKIIQEETPLLIDPCIDDPSSHLTFYNNGSVDFLTERGKVTIDILKLNRKDLIKSREKALMDLFGEWELFLKLWREKEKNWKLIQEISKKWAQIIKENSESPFIAAKKQLLQDRFDAHDDIKDFFARSLYNFKPDTKKQISGIRVKEKVIEDKLLIKKAPLDIEEKKQIEQSFLEFQTKQVYLESLELHNFKCFDDVKINFSGNRINLESEDVKQPWHLFLGENGVGKSSILKAIGIALMGSSYCTKMSEHINIDSLLKYGKRSGWIKLKYNKGEQIVVNFTKSGNKVISDLDTPLTNLIGYGSIRLLPRKTLKPESSFYSGVKIGNLFDYTIALEDANKWLIGKNKREFDRAALTLKDLMLLDNEVELVRDKNTKQIYVRFSDGQNTSIEDLSDGYKTVYALTVDIMATLSSENISYDLAEGIVLVDEIGTHLHPRWKMQVVERMRNAFPNLQFVVSTHEPLCLRGLGQGEVIVLTTDESEKITALSEVPNPNELRIDQILTSELFGLKSTFDPRTEKIFEEYYSILAKDQGERSLEENVRLHELNELIPKIKHLGDNLREELVYYVIDELLAKKVKNDGFKIKEELKEEALKRVELMWNSIKPEHL